MLYSPSYSAFRGKGATGLPPPSRVPMCRTFVSLVSFVSPVVVHGTPHERRANHEVLHQLHPGRNWQLPNRLRWYLVPSSFGWLCRWPAQATVAVGDRGCRRPIFCIFAVIVDFLSAMAAAESVTLAPVCCGVTSGCVWLSLAGSNDSPSSFVPTSSELLLISKDNATALALV